MGARNANASYRVTGRLAYGCTDLSAAWPHGGTGLGIAGKVYFNPPSQYAVTEREEDGSVGRVIYSGGRAVIGVDLLQWDDDAISICFPNTGAGSAGQLIQYPGSGANGPLPGEDVASVSNLVFTPENDTEHPAIVLYKAFPVTETNQELRMSSYQVLTVRVLFLGTEDTNGRLAAMGILSDIPGVA